MKYRLLTVSSSAVLTLALAGCSGSGSGSATSSSSAPPVPTTVSTSPTPTPATSAASGSTDSTDKTFSVVVPTGWKGRTTKGTVLMIQAAKAQDRVTTNVNVVVQRPSTLPDLDDVISSAQTNWRQEGVTIKESADRTIGDLPARGYTFTRTSQGVKITQVQYFVIYEGGIYTVTATSAQSQASQSLQSLNAVLDSWAWRA